MGSLKQRLHSISQRLQNSIDSLHQENIGEPRDHAKADQIKEWMWENIGEPRDHAEADQVKEWIWEYLLKHCQGYEVLTCLLQAFHPPEVPKLKKLFNLKLLSGFLSEPLISTTSLDCLSSLEKIIKKERDKQDSECLNKIPYIYFVLKREIAVQFLRDENYNLERFEEIMHDYWEQETISNDPEKQAAICELWSIVSKPELRTNIIGKYQRVKMEKMIKEFVNSAWTEFGQPFLEKVVHDISTGIYKPDISCELGQPFLKELVHDISIGIYKAVSHILEKTDIGPVNASSGGRVEVSNALIPSQMGIGEDLSNGENGRQDARGVAKEADFVRWTDSEEDVSLAIRRKREFTRRAWKPSDTTKDEVLILSKRRRMDHKTLNAQKSLTVTDQLLALANQLKPPAKGFDVIAGEVAAEPARVANSHLEEEAINMNSRKETVKIPDETRCASSNHSLEVRDPEGTGQENIMETSCKDVIKSKQVDTSERTRSTNRSMNRNRTVELEEIESTDQSSKEDFPSSSKCLRLPTSKQVSPLKPDSKQGSRKRKFCKWTEQEEKVLRKEVNRHGKGHWKLILQKNPDAFQNRSEVDLKDKWRNIERAEGILKI